MFAEIHERSAGAKVFIRFRWREVVKVPGNRPLEVHWLQQRLPGNNLQQADPLSLGAVLLFFEVLDLLAFRRCPVAEETDCVRIRANNKTSWPIRLTRQEWFFQRR